MGSVMADNSRDTNDLLRAIAAGDRSRWGELLTRHQERLKRMVALRPAQPNDRWAARFVVTALGRYEYTIEAWVDRFASWRRDLSRKAEAGQDVTSDLVEGAELVAQTARRAHGPDADWLRRPAERLSRGPKRPPRLAASLGRARALVPGSRLATSSPPSRKASRSATLSRLGCNAGGGVEGGLDARGGPRRSTRNSARWPTSTTSWPRRGSTASRSPSTSPSSARPTTPTSASTQSGSATGPMEMGKWQKIC
jgi:hypothetical protein